MDTDVPSCHRSRPSNGHRSPSRGAWLPHRKEPPGKDYSVQKMILGTHTSENEPNYLMLAQVQLPLEDAENDARNYDDDRADLGGFGCANGKVPLFFLAPVWFPRKSE